MLDLKNSTQNPKPLSSPPMLKKKKNKLIQIWVVLWVFVQQAPKNSKQSVPCQSFNHFILVVHTHLSLYPIAKLHKFNQYNIKTIHRRKRAPTLDHPPPLPLPPPSLHQQPLISPNLAWLQGVFFVFVESSLYFIVSSNCERLASSFHVANTLLCACMRKGNHITTQENLLKLNCRTCKFIFYIAFFSLFTSFKNKH